MMVLEAAVLALIIWAAFRIRIVAVKDWLLPLLAIIVAVWMPLSVIVIWLSRWSLLTARVRAKYAAAGAGYVGMIICDLALIGLIAYFPARWQVRRRPWPAGTNDHAH